MTASQQRFLIAAGGRASRAATASERSAARRRAARPAGLLDEATTYDPRVAAQLAVGQRVTALHPRLRQLHSGTVLSPDGDRS